MKRTAVRLGIRPLLVLAVLLAVGWSATAAYGGEDLAVLSAGRTLPSALSKGAVRGQNGGVDKYLSLDRPPSGFGDSRTPAVVYPYPPLPAMPATGSLDATTVTEADYTFYLAARQTVYLYLSGDEGTDFNIGLVSPSGTLVESAVSTRYPELLAYTVPSNAAGTYWVAVVCASGDGEYALSYGVDSDSDIPGTRLSFPATPFHGMLDSRTDFFDCFNVYAFAGQTLSVTLNNPTGADFDLYLYDAHVNPLADTYFQVGTTNSLSYVAPSSGTYYVVARTWSDVGGAGWYTLSYSRPLVTGTFHPVLSVNKSRLGLGKTLYYWGTVYPTNYSRKRTVHVQKGTATGWAESRSITLNSSGAFPKVSASYTKPTKKTIRLYMPSYSDPIRGVFYKAGYSTARTVRWVR